MSLLDKNEIANESEVRLKRGRPIGSIDKSPRKRKGAKKEDDQFEDKMSLEELSDIINSSIQ